MGVAAAVAGGLAISGLLTPPTSLAARGAPRFVEETTTAGIDHTYDGGFDHAVGGGVAVFDCNADGKADVYVAGGSNEAALYRNASPVGGAMRFARVRDAATARWRDSPQSSTGRRISCAHRR